MKIGIGYVRRGRPGGASRPRSNGRRPVGPRSQNYRRPCCHRLMVLLIAILNLDRSRLTSLIVASVFSWLTCTRNVEASGQRRAQTVERARHRPIEAVAGRIVANARSPQKHSIHYEDLRGVCLRPMLPRRAKKTAWSKRKRYLARKATFVAP